MSVALYTIAYMATATFLSKEVVTTSGKAYSYLELTICCFKVQMFIIRAQYLLLHLPDTRKQNKSCEKNNIHRKAGQTAVQPVNGRFLPARFRSGF